MLQPIPMECDMCSIEIEELGEYDEGLEIVGDLHLCRVCKVTSKYSNHMEMLKDIGFHTLLEFVRFSFRVRDAYTQTTRSI